jgi:extracellular elastinolytic metalloproteinase
MGEGWGDFFATIFRMKPDFNSTIEFGMGNWANNGKGIRKYPVSIIIETPIKTKFLDFYLTMVIFLQYSTSLKSNPETYGFIDKPEYWGVHAKG